MRCVAAVPGARRLRVQGCRRCVQSQSGLVLLTVRPHLHAGGRCGWVEVPVGAFLTPRTAGIAPAASPTIRER